MDDQKKSQKISRKQVMLCYANNWVEYLNFHEKQNFLMTSRDTWKPKDWSSLKKVAKAKLDQWRGESIIRIVTGISDNVNVVQRGLIVQAMRSAVRGDSMSVSDFSCLLAAHISSYRGILVMVHPFYMMFSIRHYLESKEGRHSLPEGIFHHSSSDWWARNHSTIDWWNRNYPKGDEEKMERVLSMNFMP
jgi:hypothetical protein